MEAKVYFKCVKWQGDTRNFFEYLGVRTPEKLPQDLRQEYKNDTLLYIQKGSSRLFDDIDEFREREPDYIQVMAIFILAMVTSDGEKKHMCKCEHSMRKTDKNISLLEFHCSYHYDVYSCKGNSANREFLLSKLPSIEQDKYKYGGQTEVKSIIDNKQMIASYDFSTTSWVTRLRNGLQFAFDLSAIALFRFMITRLITGLLKVSLLRRTSQI